MAPFSKPRASLSKPLSAVFSIPLTMLTVLALDMPVSTTDPVVTLPEKLPPGRYQITLSVESDRGRSEPAKLTLIIEAR